MSAEAARNMIVSSIAASMRLAADAKAEVLSTWPGDTQYDGCEEEALAASLEVTAAMAEQHAQDLALILEELS